MTDLTVEDYSEKSIVVRGDTKSYKDDLKKLGGKWNAGLKDGGGWIFSKKKEADVMEYVSSGKMTAPDSAKTRGVESKSTVAKSPPKEPKESDEDTSKELRKLRKQVEKMSLLLEKVAGVLLHKEEDEPKVEEDDEKPRKRLLK